MLAVAKAKNFGAIIQAIALITGALNKHCERGSDVSVRVQLDPIQCRLAYTFLIPILSFSKLTACYYSPLDQTTLLAPDRQVYYKMWVRQFTRK